MRPEELKEEMAKLEEEGASKREELEREERDEKGLRDTRCVCICVSYLFGVVSGGGVAVVGVGVGVVAVC